MLIRYFFIPNGGHVGFVAFLNNDVIEDLSLTLVVGDSKGSDQKIRGAEATICWQDLLNLERNNMSIIAKASDYEERIRAMAAEGLPARVAAATLGLTRNQVLGIAWRKGIQFRPKMAIGRPRRAPMPRFDAAPKKPKPASRIQEEIKMDVEAEVEMMTSPAGKRHWKPLIVTCCWHGCKAPPVAAGKPYCERHHKPAKFYA